MRKHTTKDLDPWSCNIGKMTVENENCDIIVDRMISLFKIIAIMITGSCKDSSYQFYVKLKKKNFLIYRLQILVIYLKSSSLYIRKVEIVFNFPSVHRSQLWRAKSRQADTSLKLKHCPFALKTIESYVVIIAIINQNTHILYKIHSIILDAVVSVKFALLRR